MIIPSFYDRVKHIKHIYPSELQYNKANVSDTEVSFLDLHLSISEGFIKIKLFDKRADFHFVMVNFPFLDGDIPRSTSLVLMFLNLFALLECKTSQTRIKIS